MKERVNPVVATVIVAVVVIVIVGVGLKLMNSNGGSKTPPKEKLAEIEQRKKAAEHFMSEMGNQRNRPPSGTNMPGMPGSQGMTGHP